MAAIYKREMHSYLTSAVGYVFLAVFFAISGYYFFATSLVSNSTDPKLCLFPTCFPLPSFWCRF